MVIILSLVVAVVFGAGDFCGGVATKRTSVLQVVALSHLVGLVGVLVASIVISNEFIWSDVLLGAVGGVFGGLGVGLLYRCLSTGPMSVIAPVTAITSALVPAAWGVIDGERLTALVWLGLGLALVAIGLISWSPNDDGVAVTGRTVVESLLAGVGFGLFFILIDATSSESAPWPILGARAITGVTLLAFLLLTGKKIVPPTSVATGLIVLTGIFDTLSNVLFLYATNQGQLTLVSILSSLYPASTVVLAWLFLKERMTMVQGMGFVVALAATICIGAG